MAAQYKVSVWCNGEPFATYKANNLQSLIEVCKEDWEYEFSNGRFEFYVYEDDIEVPDTEFRLALGLNN